MAGVRAIYQVVGEQALQRLTGLDLRTRDLTPVMQDFAGYMVGAVQRNFDAQGRPTRWAPLKLSTLNAWIGSRKSFRTKTGNMSKKGLEALAGRKILTGSARLRNSITFKALSGGKGVEGSTNVIYAAIHHFGGQTKPHIIVPRIKKALSWPGAAYPVKLVQHPGSKIPARPFLMFQDEDVYGYLYPRIAVYLEGA